MNKYTSLICAIILCSFIIVSSAAPAKEVTNEEIRDAILSLVHSYSLLDNKLERHEHRERALGELVKRALQGLQKGQKAFEPMNGIFSRLDERVSQIETMLMTQEDKYNTQSDRLAETLENIFKWMKDNNECFKSASFVSAPQKIIDDSDNKELKNQVGKLSANVENLLKSSEKMLQQSEKLIQSKLSDTDEVITKLEDKLSHFYITGPATPTPEESAKNTEFEEKVSNRLDDISNKLLQLREPQSVEKNKLTTEDKIYLENLANNTISILSNIKSNQTSLENELSKISSEIANSKNGLNNAIVDVQNSLSVSSDKANEFYNHVNQSYTTLREGLDVFNKFDKILLSTSDYVLETQRKIEFGTHQILQKVGILVKEQNAELNKTIQQRLDDIDASIISSHLEALQNLSSTMESEISHVWRQIEIMHSEIATSKDALNKIQGQTESYVNGTISTMDSMTGKISQITERMTEVDGNLNFLLGRLSLVTQEFNRIKSGLGSTLDEIRNSFQDVQNKIQKGANPHDSNEDNDLKHLLTS